MTVEHLHPESDASELAANLPPELVRETLKSHVDRQAQALLEHYGEHDGIREAINATRTQYARGHQFAAKPQLTLSHQGKLTSVFFTIETIHNLVSLVPALAERRQATLSTVQEKHASTTVWSDLDPGYLQNQRVPDLPTAKEYWNAGDYLGPEARYLDETVLTPEIGTGPVSYFKLWRNPDLFGLRTALRGRDAEALKRFALPIVQMVDSPSTVRAFEDAYFEHMTREINRAYFPFGLSDQSRREFMCLAVALAFESESGGTFNTALAELDKVEPGSVTSNSTLVRAHRSLIAWLLHRPMLVARIQSFDLIRAAAAVQLHFSARGTLHDPVAPSGWARSLQTEAFGVTTKKDAPYVEEPPTSPSARHPFARELLRLLPYSPPLAVELSSMWPAGSIRKIVDFTKNVELPFTQGSARGDAIVFHMRRGILGGLYREQIKDEQLGQPGREPSLRNVQSVLTHLLKWRLNDTLKLANRLPREVPLSVSDAESDEGREELRAFARATAVSLEHDTLIARAKSTDTALLREDIANDGASRLGASAVAQSKHARRSQPAPSAEPENWIDEFFDIFPTHRRLWVAYRQYTSTDNGNGLTTLELAQLAELATFTVWLRAEVHRREWTVVRAAEEIHAATESQGLDRGRELPTRLHQHELANTIGTVSDALKLWLNSRPDLKTAAHRNAARDAITTLFDTIYTSPLWRSLALEDHLVTGPAGELTASLNALKHNTLRDLMPRLLAELIRDPDDSRHQEQDTHG